MKTGSTQLARFILTAVVLVIVLSFIGTATLVWAQPSPSSSPQASVISSPSAPPLASISPNPTSQPNTTIMFGRVFGINPSGTSLDIQTDDKTPITIKVNSNTKYHLLAISPYSISSIVDIIEAMGGQTVLPGMPGMTNEFGAYAGLSRITQAGSFSDIAKNDFIVLSATITDNLAASIYITKMPPNVKFVNGTLSALLPNNYFTVTPPSPAFGQAVTIGWDENTRFTFKGANSLIIGQSIGVIYDASSQMADFVSIRTLPGATSASPIITASPSAAPAASPTAVQPVSPSVGASPVPSPSTESDVTTVDLTIQNHTFDKTEITVPEGNEIIITLHNNDAGVQHNFSVYNSSMAITALYQGVPVIGTNVATYQFTAPQITATYYFRCDVHPAEHGLFVLGGRNVGE